MKSSTRSYESSGPRWFGVREAFVANFSERGEVDARSETLVRAARETADAING